MDRITVKEFFIEESKFNKGLMILVALDVNGNKWVCSGHHHAPTYLKPYDRSSDTKEQPEKRQRP